jgi:hypothetical protein
MDHPFPGLKYLDAGSVNDEMVDFDGMEVESPTGEHLGDVRAFIVDAASGRPYYVAVDAGGWFRSKEFLLPVGHVRLDTDREALVADLSRERIEKFPGFDRDVFEKMSEDELRRFNEQTCSACTIEGVAVVSAPGGLGWERSDYQAPEWWRAVPPGPGRAAARGAATGAELWASPAPGAPRPERRERGVAHDSGRARRETDPSPHYDGRAQPGDVLGVETGGERTHVGDTKEDENERRRQAEEADRKTR